jgi:hypothetical protein
VGRGSGRRPQKAGLELCEVWAAVPQARRRAAVYWLAVMARRSKAAHNQDQKAATAAEPLLGRGGEPWSR